MFFTGHILLGRCRHGRVGSWTHPGLFSLDNATEREWGKGRRGYIQGSDFNNGQVLDPKQIRRE